MKSEASRNLPDTFNFVEAWHAIQRRQLIIWAFTGILLLLALLYCLFATRKYTATSTIEVRRTSRDSLGLDTSLGITDTDTADSLAINIESETQAGILHSDDYALRVLSELRLENSSDFKGGFNPLGAILRLFSPKAPAGGPRPNRYAKFVPAFEKNLKVTPAPGTRLIDISYKSKEPETAKAVVDRLTLDLLNSSADAQRETSAGSSKFIEDQLAGIRAQTEQLQSQVAKMQQQSGIVSLGTTSADGREQVYSVILDELEQIGTTLGQAQTNRILKGAVYDQIRYGNPELISVSNGNLNSAAAPGIASSLQTIQSLRVLMTNDQATLAQMEVNFGSGYPRVQGLRDEIAAYDRQIQDEIARMRERAKNDYEVALKTEADARDTYMKLKSKADAINSSAIDYAIAKEEAESSRKLYEDLLSRSKQATIIQGLRPSNVEVVSAAMLPTTPSSPKVLLVLGAALFLGLTVGTGIAFLADLADKRIVSLPAITESFGRAPKAVLPALTRSELVAFPGVQNLTGQPAPESSYVEGIRALANSLFFSYKFHAPRLLLITSPGGREGKTMLSVNLAALLAQQGRRILLIDANRLGPGVQTAFHMDNSPGLADLFSPSISTSPIAVRAVASHPGLSILTTGDVSRLPSDVFSMPRFNELLSEFQEQFDCVLVDGAPVLPLNDAAPIASRAESVLLVVTLNQTELQQLRAAQAKLEQFVPSEHLQLVVNNAGGSRSQAA